jgi:hypothetical protein
MNWHGRHPRNGRKHKLIDAENDGWNAFTSDGGLFEHTFQTEIFCAEWSYKKHLIHASKGARTQISNETTGFVTECK